MAKVTITSKTYSFTNGTANDAAPVDASFTTLFNNDDALKTAVNHLEDGNFNETSTATLNATYSGSSPSANGVFQVERGTLANTMVRWNESTDVWEFSNDGTNFYSLMLPNTLEGFNQTAAPLYATAATFTVAKINCANNANDGFIRKTASTTADISTTGLNGVAQSAALAGTVSTAGSSTTITGSGTAFNTDFQVGDVIWTASGARRITNVGGATTLTVESVITLSAGTAYKRGGEAPSTWYNLYAITDGTTPGLILSNRNVANGTDTLADLPLGYTKSRQMAFAVRNDSSNNLLPFMVGDGWPTRPYIGYRDFESTTSYEAAPLAGTMRSTTFAAIDLSALAPKISKMVAISGVVNGTTNTPSLSVRATGSGLSTGRQIGRCQALTATYFADKVITDASQSIDYMHSASTSSADSSLRVNGFYVTEV